MQKNNIFLCQTIYYFYHKTLAKAPNNFFYHTQPIYKTQYTYLLILTKNTKYFSLFQLLK